MFTTTIFRQGATRFISRMMSTSASGSRASTSEAMSTTEAIAKLATAAALGGAGVAIVLSPERGDADYLDCQNHCHDELP